MRIIRREREIDVNFRGTIENSRYQSLNTQLPTPKETEINRRKP